MSHFAFDLQHPPELSTNEYREAIDALLEQERQEVAAARAYEEGASRLQTTHAERVRELITAAKGDSERYDSFRSAHRDRLRTLRANPRPDDAARGEIDTERRALAAESEALLAELEIDGALLQQMNVELQQELMRLERETIGVAEPGDVQPRVKNQDFGPWANPPTIYSGGISSVQSFVSEGDSSDDVPNPTCNLFFDWQFGKLGNDSAISVSDASNYDEAALWCTTSLLQWYKLPATGMVQVQYTAQYVDAHMDGSVDPDWYGSNSYWLEQEAAPFAVITWPILTPRAYFFIHGGIRQDPSISNWGGNQWSQNWAAAGSLYDSPSVVVPAPFPKGTWVLLKFGLANWNHLVSNDYSIVSHLSTKLWINKLGITVQT